VEYAEISNARTLARMFNYVTGDLFKNVRDPGQFPFVIRYFVAGFIMLLSLTFAFLNFSRSVPKAIEAIGRNPLARTAIMVSLGVTIGLAVVTVSLGLAISIVILRI
jgi:F0F1-type ATP synthase membrane subunit c/vacuolar-type H+-ATPase subunit K